MLKHLGHLRWQSFERLTGVPTRLVADHEGRRLYATFYYVDIEFPPSAPPHAFRENDRVVWVGGLAACGRNILDGDFALYRARRPRAERGGRPTRRRASASSRRESPSSASRTSSSPSEAGPDQLRMGQPANADFSGIPALREPPAGYERNRRARETGRFFEPPAGARPSPPATAAVELPIDPDRDVNAAGLVYFGKLPGRLPRRRAARARRAADGRPPARLRGRARHPPAPDRLLRQRARRRRLRIAGRVRGPARSPSRPAPPPGPYGLMWFSLRVERCSDGRLVAITTAERVTPLVDPDDAERWRAYARQVG